MNREWEHMVIVKARRLRIQLLCCVTLLCCFAVNAEEPDPAAILQLLKASDARFDNMLLAYQRTGKRVLAPFPSWKYPHMKVKKEELQTRILPFSMYEQFVVRGSEITKTSEADTNVCLHGEDGTVSACMGAYHKVSNIGGVTRELNRSDGTREGKVVHHFDATFSKPHEGFDSMGMALSEAEWSLGIGYGHRLTRIESVERTNDGWRLTGVMSGDFTNTVMTCELEADANWLVRRAQIETLWSSNGVRSVTRVVVTTKGDAGSNGVDIALNGQFRRTTQFSKDGMDAQPEREQSSFDVEFKSLKLNLTEAEYGSLADMTLPEGTRVKDRSENSRYTVGPSGTRTNIVLNASTLWQHQTNSYSTVKTAP